MKCKLYKAFIVPYFSYCSIVWHFCGARNKNKLEQLNKRGLRIVLDEKSLHYREPLSRFNSVICIALPRCQDMMKTVFKTIQFETMPKYSRGLFQTRNTEIKETCYPIHQYNHLWSSLLQIYFCKHVEQTNRGPEVINDLE